MKKKACALCSYGFPSHPAIHIIIVSNNNDVFLNSQRLFFLYSTTTAYMSVLLLKKNPLVIKNKRAIIIKNKYQLPHASQDSGSSSEQAICAKASSLLIAVNVALLIAADSCACLR